MQRFTTAVAVILTVLGAAVAASAQTLTPGGLTALPGVSNLGPNLLQNGTFESGTTGWSNADAAWGADQLVKHGGTFSIRMANAPGVALAQILTQNVTLTPGVYKLSGWVRTDALGANSAGSGVRIGIEYGTATTRNYGVMPVVNGTRDWTYYEVPNIVVTENRTGVVKLEAYAEPSGTAWFDDIQLQQQVPTALDVFLLYPNYRGMLFDDKPQTMRFDVTVTPPAGADLTRYKVTATLAAETSGTTVTTQTYTPTTAQFVATLSGAAMQAGQGYLVKFALVDTASNATVYTYPAYRVSKVPASQRATMNIAFDEKNHVLYRGTPRFLLGVYDSGMSYVATDQQWEDLLWSPTGQRRMGGMNINLYLNYWYGDALATSMDSLAANLDKHGVKYLQTGNCFDRASAAAMGPFAIDTSDAYVRDIGSQPGIAGYYTIDECVSSLIPGAFDQYQRLKRLDPDSMSFAALLAGSGSPDYYLWRDAADLISSDPYALYGAEPAGGYNHRFVADSTVQIRDAVKDARPFAMVLQFFQFTSQGRWPTLPEMRNHAYMAIVEGAKGLLWWSLGDNALAPVCSGWCQQKTDLMNRLKTVVNEIAALEPVLLADDAAGALIGNTNSNIRTKVKVVNGKGYVFSYNYTNLTQSTTFTWNTAPGAVTVNAEGRTIAASGNGFTDSFGPYAAHVYVIADGGTVTPSATPTPTPVPGAVTVSFTNPPTGATVSGTTTVTMSGSGGTGTYTYKLEVDGATVYTGTNATFSWNTLNSTNGAHTLKATVTDTSSPVQSGTAMRAVTVSNTTPTPTPTGSLVPDFSGMQPGAVLSWTASINVGVKGATGTANTFTLSVDGRPIGTKTVTTAWTSFIWDTIKETNASHTLTLTVKDATGKTGTATLSVNTQNAGAPVVPAPTPTSTPTPAPTPAPTGTLVPNFSLPPGTVLNWTASIFVGVKNAVGPNTFTLKVDGTPIGTTTASTGWTSFAWNTKTTANGSHTLTLTVKDATGNTGTSTLAVTVRN